MSGRETSSREAPGRGMGGEEMHGRKERDRRCTQQRDAQGERRLGGEMRRDKMPNGRHAAGEMPCGEAHGKGDTWRGSNTSTGVTKESTRDVPTGVEDS